MPISGYLSGIVTIAVAALIQFGIFGVAQGQVNITSLTPEQKAAICNPNNPKLKFVNSTESKICGISPTPTNTTTTTMTTPAANTTTPTMGKQSPSLYEQGYAKGVADAKLVQSKFPASTTMSPDDVDCNSDIDPKANNKDYCSGYQHGFADTINNQLLGK